MLRTAALALALGAGPAGACNLALALAVDVSGSVDTAEYRLQMEGLAAGLAEPSVAAALIDGRAAVSVVQWTGTGRQAVVVPWARVTDAGALAALTAEVAAVERRWWMFSTGIGEALRFTAAQFAEVSDCTRAVIDVSGDGRSNEGLAPRPTALALAEAGITVNGLAIEGSEPGLTAYFREHVIAGPGAFVITARDFDDYPRAIRQKLIAEVVRPVTREAAPPLWMAGR